MSAAGPRDACEAELPRPRQAGAAERRRGASPRPAHGATPGDRFVKEMLVRFSHCDPAGIVFYPQYFVLFNALVEDWFNEALGIDYAAFIRERRVGLPTVKIASEFLRPSRIGERLTMSLAVTKMGRRSLVLSIDGSSGGEERLRTEQVLVTTSLDTHRSIEIPADLRARIARFPSSVRGRSSAMKILQPSGWAKPRGYANGVAVKGTLVFVAGQIGWNGECRFEATDFVGQVRQALANIVAVLGEAGARPEHVVRMTWYVTDRREYLEASRQIGPIFREIIGAYNAAMTAVEVSALMEDQAKVEIEATAVVPD